MESPSYQEALADKGSHTSLSWYLRDSSGWQLDLVKEVKGWHEHMTTLWGQRHISLRRAQYERATYSPIMFSPYGC